MQDYPSDARSLSVKEFCRLEGIGKDRFYQEVRLRRLRARKAGRRTIITPEDRAAWHAALPVLKLAS
jgi:hypothetical protein